MALLIIYLVLLVTVMLPVTPNCINIIAMLFNRPSALRVLLPQWKGQRRRLLRLAGAAALGAATGAALLLLTPSSAFERIVPWLIAGASVALLFSRPPQALAIEGFHTHPAHRDPW